MDDGIFGKRLFAFHMTASTDYAVVRDCYARRNRTFALEHILLANFRCFDSGSDFKYIICSNQKYRRFSWWFDVCVLGRPIDYRWIFFDQTILTDDDWTSFSDNCDARMNDAPTRNGDITNEYAIIAFADYCFRHYFQTATELNESRISDANSFESNTHSFFVVIFLLENRICCSSLVNYFLKCLRLNVYVRCLTHWQKSTVSDGAIYISDDLTVRSSTHTGTKCVNQYLSIEIASLEIEVSSFTALNWVQVLRRGRRQSYQSRFSSIFKQKA